MVPSVVKLLGRVPTPISSLPFLEADMSDLNEHEQLIRGLPLMARLSKEDLGSLASLGQVRSHRAGTYIFHQGDPGDSIYIILEGGLRISRISESGKESILALMGPGEACGELALLDGRPRSASAAATGVTKTLVVGRPDFIRWLSTRPGAALCLLETLSLLVRRKDEALADLAFLELSLRLARQLLDLAARAQDTQALDGRQGVTRIHVTQEGLASMLGVSRESVNKELNRLARDCWIELGRGSVTLADPESLREFAFGGEGLN